MLIRHRKPASTRRQSNRRVFERIDDSTDKDKSRKVIPTFDDVKRLRNLNGG